MQATLSRNIGALEESGSAGLLGIWSPLPAEVVRARYPDHAAYLLAFEKATEAAVDAGVLRPRDAQEAIERAKAAML